MTVKPSNEHLLSIASCSFRNTVVCQMLNNDPTAAVHDYDPGNHPRESEALRAALLRIVDEPSVKDGSPQPPKLPDNTPERELTPPPSEPVSAPRTPQRSQPAPSHVGHPGSFNIYFSPNVAVRVNSPSRQCALLIVMKLIFKNRSFKSWSLNA